ncbi:hypothetical protein QWA68_006258 [Fusarium oxysporum]|nr:hypothetical protein QWA68_006258 [Fusarium oxysporum]
MASLAIVQQELIILDIYPSRRTRKFNIKYSSQKRQGFRLGTFVLLPTASILLSGCDVAIFSHYQELPGAPRKELSAGRSGLRGNCGSGKISTSHQDQRIIHYTACARFCHEKYGKWVRVLSCKQKRMPACSLGPRP